MNTILFFGQSRSGKTTRAIKIFQKLNHHGIFINTQWEDYFKGFKISYSFKDWHFYKKMILNPSDEYEVLKFCREIIERQRKRERLYPYSIFIDELDKYVFDKSSIETISNLFSRGLRWNIQTVGIVQMPQLIDFKIYKNAQIYYIFKMNRILYSYFQKNWKINLFEVERHLEQKYNYVIWTGCKLVKRYKSDV